MFKILEHLPYERFDTYSYITAADKCTVKLLTDVQMVGRMDRPSFKIF